MSTEYPSSTGRQWGGVLDPQETSPGKGEGQFKEPLKHSMLSNKSNLNQEYPILVGIISIISYSGKQHGKSLAGQLAQSTQVN